MTKAGHIIEAVWIYECLYGRKLLLRLVVVDDDDVESEPACLPESFVTGGPTIDGHEKGCALPGECRNGLCIRAISFKKAVRDVNERAPAATHEIAPEYRRRGRPVHVVIAKNRDALSPHDGVSEPGRGNVHIGKGMRIRHRRAHGGSQESRNLIHIYRASRKNAREQIGNAVALGDRKRPGCADLIEPVTPGASAHGLLDRKKQPPVQTGRMCQWNVHA